MNTVMVMTIAGGVAFLAGRPAFVTTSSAGPAMLAAGYAALCTIALLAPTRARVAVADLAHSSADEHGSGSGRAAWTLVLALGVGAIFVARWLAGPGLQLPAGAWAFALNAGAAVTEEAFFRRFLYARLERWGAWAAVLGSASAFALAHLPGYGFTALPLDLGAGLLLSWQRWATGRWEVPATTHVLANVLAVIP
jgi:membrane protease YdiL (CAAX protease family)